MVWAPSSIINLRLKQGTRLEKLYYELNGVRTEFVASVKYFGEPETEGVWRIFVNPSNQLVRQRYENGSYVDYGADGSSTSFTDVILRGTEYGLYSQDISDVYRPLVRTAFTDEKGVAVGNESGLFVMLHNGTALSGEPGEAYDTTMNTGTDESETDEYTETVTPDRYKFINSFDIYLADVPADTKLRFTAVSESGNILYENVTEYEFSIGDGADVEDGTNSLTLNPSAYRDIAGVSYDLTFYFSNTVKIIGKQNGTFLAKIRTVGHYIDIKNVSIIPTWQTLYYENSGDFEAGDICLEEGVTYICRVTGAQATDFATNAVRWAELGTVVLSGGVFGGQTINGGLDNNEDLTLYSTADATKGNINLGDNSTYDELNDRLGLNTTTPTKTLDVNGDVNITGFTKLGSDSGCSPIKLKCLCGTLDSDSQTSVAHGITLSKIITVTAMVHNGTCWYFGEYNNTPFTPRAIRLKVDATNVIFDEVGSEFQGNDYRLSIIYIE